MPRIPHFKPPCHNSAKSLNLYSSCPSSLRNSHLSPRLPAMSHPPSLLSPLIPVLHAGQTALAAYAAQHSYEAITRVQQYEKQTEKAAQYSDTADRQLKRTRSTQAAGAGAVRWPCSFHLHAGYPTVHFNANNGPTDRSLAHLLNLPHHCLLRKESWNEAMVYKSCSVRSKHCGAVCSEDAHCRLLELESESPIRPHLQ